jgi:hypothetical protein
VFQITTTLGIPPDYTTENDTLGDIYPEAFTFPNAPNNFCFYYLNNSNEYPCDHPGDPYVPDITGKDVFSPNKITTWTTAMDYFLTKCGCKGTSCLEATRYVKLLVRATAHYETKVKATEKLP